MSTDTVAAAVDADLAAAMRGITIAFPGVKALDEVDFTLRAGDLSFIGVNNRPMVEPGTYDVWIAPSAEADGVHGTFELTA